MPDQIIPIAEIVQNARAAFDAGHPVSFCPYPIDSDAGNRWRIAYYAREMDLLGEAA